MEIICNKFGKRVICTKGIGKIFYQEGLPLSIAISELRKKNIEVSMLHVVEEFWENDWSWKTIRAKLKGEMDIDIDKSMNIDFNKLKHFYDCLEQPRRSNGGYEESREIIFKYLFNTSTDKVRIGEQKHPIKQVKKMLIG